MAREMLVNVAESEECRVAVVEGGCLEELYVERASLGSHVGNIYKGKVVNIESGIQAAFVDIGIGRNGFLHISDVHPRHFPGARSGAAESIGRRKALKERPSLRSPNRRSGHQRRSKDQRANSQHISCFARQIPCYDAVDAKAWRFTQNRG